MKIFPPERICRLRGRERQRLHEGNGEGELQAHQGGGETDCRRRVGAHRW